MMRRSRQEILELFQACQAKLGRTPGMAVFCKAACVKLSEVLYYWPNPGALVKEAGGQPNKFRGRLDDVVVFQEYAKVCLHLGKVPSRGELRIAQRELDTQTQSVYGRDGGIAQFQEKFRAWSSTAGDELKAILAYSGWSSKGPDVPSEIATPAPHLHPFLPGCLQYLDVLARGERPPFESSDLGPGTLFERRTADAFRCLGFELRQLGQGTGRNADCIATARRERVALIIDAKTRASGYTLGTEDRKFLEYAKTHSNQLQNGGFERIYLVVVGPSFREPDLKKLADYLSQTPIRSVDMITAHALMRMVEGSIKDRSTFSLESVATQLFGNKIISS